MNRLYFFIAIIFIPFLAFGQARNAGRMMVPIGYENYDSLRFYLYGIDGAFDNLTGPDTAQQSLLLRILDSVSNTFACTGSDPTFPIGNMKGVVADYASPILNNTFLFNTSVFFKQWEFSALPHPRQGINGEHPYWPRGYLWRYNDANGINTSAKVDSNWYDANDISPYSEFPANDVFVKDTFRTYRFNNTIDSLAYYGNEGRVILGYSDINNARNLLKTFINIGFPKWVGSTPVPDTAHLFSANLEFAIDTTVPIDTSLANGRSINNLPLVRLQILFKQGDTEVFHGIDIGGWSVLPFVPFKDSANPTNPGWWCVVDTTITLGVYHNLPYDWREEDKLASGSLSHPTWAFKQLHVQLKNMPQSMKNLIEPINYPIEPITDMFGTPDGALFDSVVHPDFLVGADTNLFSVDSALLEMRVLSTYRATVRVRDLTLQDTIVDKFLYRQRNTVTGFSYSCNPDGTPGGYDDSMQANLQMMQDSLHARGHLPFEERLNDTGPDGSAVTSIAGPSPLMGYTDYMASKYNIHIHPRPQDYWGTNMYYFRRARISYDDSTPSVMEMQNGSNVFEGNSPGGPDTTYLQNGRSLPADYVINSWHQVPGTSWRNRVNFLHNLVICPPIAVDSTDSLSAYHAFESGRSGCPVAMVAVRRCAHAAHDHPKDRRMALDYSMYSWSFNTLITYYDTVKEVDTLYHHGSPSHTTLYDSSAGASRFVQDTQVYTTHLGLDSTKHYILIVRRFNDSLSGYDYASPATPLQIPCLLYGAIANGASSINTAQPFESPFLPFGTADTGIGDISIFGNSVSVDPTGQARYQGNGTLVHNYNFGHQYTPFAWGPIPDIAWSLPDTNDANGDLPNFYLGYSNSWRAHTLALNRINQIYDSTAGRITPHPLRYMTWLDAYSNNRTHPHGRLENPYNLLLDGFDGPDPTPMMPDDSLSKLAGFLKVDSSVSVKRWSRTGGNGPYIDSVGKDVDSASYVEVGLFMDSTSTSLKNYAAMLINTRVWPSNDSTEIAYYNNGLATKDKMGSTLGDIDVRKVYLKLDVTKTDPTFQFLSGQPQTYYVVRDLWHPDSTWLVNKDSTFAVYLKPSDAKFLYFEKGVAIDVAAQAGTNNGESTAAEFGFNNGRRVAEIMHGTRDVITYTRSGKLYVATPAAGSTFAGSPDQSSGDNIITGNEIALDTVHSDCARPSICTAENDMGVALTYWFQFISGQGGIAASWRKTPNDPWQTVTYTGSQTFDDSSYDHRWSTPVITPINDTAWLIAACNHSPSLSPLRGIMGVLFITPPNDTPYFLTTPAIPLAVDAGPDTNSYAAYPTLASRSAPYDSAWPVHLAFQQGTVPGHRDIFFMRWKSLMTAPAFDSIVNVSEGLDACDNVHPSLATNGTVELAHWLIPLDFFGTAKFYHDNLAWETELNAPVYLPVIRARHEVDSPSYKLLGWGAFNEFNNGSIPYQYPQIAAESRTYDGRFAFPTDSSHDWIRMAYGAVSPIRTECWSPNWLYFVINESYLSPQSDRYPTLAQTTNNPSFWPDSGSAPRSISWIQSYSGDVPVRVTNGYLPRTARSINPNVLLEPSIHPCDTPVFIGPKNLTIIPPTGPIVLVNWDAVNLSSGDAAEAWDNPENVPNAVHTDAFAIQACDSILIPRTCDTNGLTEMQDSLKSGSDYVMFRMKLLRKSDSAWIGTIDSMIVTKTVKYWAGSFFGINPTMARYEVPCTSSPDSAFVSMEVLREDTTNSIRRYYVNIMDTLPPVVALKEATKPEAIPDYDQMAVSVYPNPTNGLVTIQAGPFPAGLHAYVEVVNAMGAVVATPYDGTPSGEMGVQLQLNCSDWPSGTYYVHAVNEIMGKTVRLQLIK